jgi:hypothetical protein
MWALQVWRGKAARGRLLRSSGPLPSHHHVMAVIFSSMSDWLLAEALPATAWKSLGKGISAWSICS